MKPTLFFVLFVTFFFGSIQSASSNSVTCKSHPIVAVIDTGIDSEHLHLKDNLWRDPSSANNVFGYDFVQNTDNPKDSYGHGTHISGIIKEINPCVQIMSLRYYSDQNPGSVNLDNTVRAINYAVDHGANFINYSGGGPEFSEREYLALKRAEEKGIIVIAAAGNEHQNTDLVENYYYPASYKLSNIISVASITANYKLVESSNWGKYRVDVASYGENIKSYLPHNRMGFMTGTSQATAVVSGTISRLLARFPDVTMEKLKTFLLKKAQHRKSLAKKVSTGGFIDPTFFAKLIIPN